jgi:hypothetical protein
MSVQSDTGIGLEKLSTSVLRMHVIVGSAVTQIP